MVRDILRLDAMIIMNVLFKGVRFYSGIAPSGPATLSAISESQCAFLKIETVDLDAYPALR